LHRGLVLYGFAYQVSATSLPVWAYVTSGCMWTAGVDAGGPKQLERRGGCGAASLLCGGP
jgi:hypothetical protein